MADNRSLLSCHDLLTALGRRKQKKESLTAFTYLGMFYSPPSLGRLLYCRTSWRPQDQDLLILLDHSTLAYKWAEKWSSKKTGSKHPNNVPLPESQSISGVLFTTICSKVEGWMPAVTILIFPKTAGTPGFCMYLCVKPAGGRSNTKDSLTD